MSENSDSSRCINFADSFCATKSCCRLNCLTSINQEECARVKLSMCAMSLKEQKSWMLTTFSTAYCSDSHKFHHMLCGKSICSRAFTTITGISKSRYYEVRSSFLQGQFQVMKTSPSTRFHVETRTGNAMAQAVCNRPRRQAAKPRACATPMQYDQAGSIRAVL